MFYPLQNLKKKDLENKRVLVRVDFNVPVKNKKVTENSRIKASALTLNYLRKMGAKVIVVTHLGRPEGKSVRELSLKPVALELSKVLKSPKEKSLKIRIVPFTKEISKTLTKMKSGDVVMLENIRFYEGEERCDSVFVRSLASCADLFVLDGFAVAHRAAASVSGVAQILPSYVGFLLRSEITMLDSFFHSSKKPTLAIIGGAKIETKLPVIKNLLKVADHVLVGGAIVNTYWASRGYGVGDSLVDGKVSSSLSLLRKKQVILPVDVVVGDRHGKKIRVVEIGVRPHQICSKGEAIFDIGPETLALFCSFIQKAKNIVWNGAMGYFEVAVYASGTYEVARCLGDQKQKQILVGGGETIEVMNLLHIPSQKYFASTGGGAMLEYLSGKKLPGIEALRRK